MGADELAESFDGFVETIGTRAGELRDDELYSSPENRASAHRFLLGMTIARLEEHVLFEPDFPEDEHPRAVTVKLDALGDVLPADTPRLGAKDRAQEIAVRRRHVQQRFGN
ncbi:hypothetical protein [Nocardioides jensenii]|uniref:hypothetical protein n=1 Tax=Nocardioides jensenii TaxID=1843 RepID=UPI000832CEC6|nr:hypothetical protein [Nocardioides jensenii]